ncbi:uncharacterized protein LOC109408064 [Aedes albopictus]|uniref:Uncharacterized protein n=1 Tax=Aedes albopictus TaxID=7160 RepID=A0ABM1ZAW2_AEDAL
MYSYSTMDPETVQYITLSGPILPAVAVVITEEQRAYNPVLDRDARELGLDVMLLKAGLDNYNSIIINDHGITSPREFSELQGTDVKLFCRVARDRVLFRKLLLNLKTLFNESAEAEEGSSAVEMLTANSKKFKDFLGYLNSRSDGKAIMKYYEDNATLTNTLRNELAKMIVMDAAVEGLEINGKFYDLMSKKIAATFVTESPEIYYKPGYTTPEGGRIGPSGKLVKRKGTVLQSLGLKKPKEKKTDTVPTSTVIHGEEQLSARDWLVYGRSPIEMVRTNWEACFELRQEDIKKAKDLSELFQLYPILADPKAGFLIELDFERLYPGATSSFYSRFPLLHNKLDKLISSAVTKDKAFQPLYDAYSHTSDGNKKDYLLCLLLPLIVQTNYRIKGSWKPSVRETQESFILEVEVSYKITIIRQILKNEQQKSESL